MYLLQSNSADYRKPERNDPGRRPDRQPRPLVVTAEQLFAVVFLQSWLWVKGINMREATGFLRRVASRRELAMKRRAGRQ
jgi:hypothetical protein